MINTVAAIAAAAMVATVGVACTPGPGDDAAPGAGDQQTTDQQTDQQATGAPMATNPVYEDNFPDPQVIRTQDGWVAISTNGNGANVQTLTSPDLVEWSVGPDAMPTLAEWTSPGKVWAPEAIQIGERWVMYYTTRAPDPEVQCIGVATAERPEGPYADESSAPLLCETEAGGSIDASGFVDSSGQVWLYSKNDGNAIGVDTWISVQRLSDDGLSLVGESKKLFKQDLDWEGHLVEGPYVWEHEGVFHMFYSGNDYGSDQYAVGHATADAPDGEFVKDPEPVLATNDVAAGPGHCALFEADGQVWMVYHSWLPGRVGEIPPGRTMWLSTVDFGVGGDSRAVTVSPPATEIPQLR
ncbi:glycoside hydrolase family 43 protein [Propionibacteriaceae bacterium Y1685]|uniref:glycoside hydrolase family 43 protein n=1 Tax=Microlunatus sp. Y1700 TaxID=3418487 RepID=UPI003B7A242B